MLIIKIINLLHLLLFLGLVTSVLINNYQIKKFSLTLLIFIFIQFITNYGKCGLTELDYVLRGEKYKEGFIYRLVKPVITIPENYFNKYFYTIHILWIIILWKQLHINN